MPSLFLFLLFLMAAVPLPAGTIATSAHCTNHFAVINFYLVPGGPGVPHAECGGWVFDRGSYHSGYYRADAAPGNVSISFDEYRFAAALNGSVTATYEERYTVTFFGGSGFGHFMPCLSVTASSLAASALAGVNQLTSPLGWGSALWIASDRSNGDSCATPGAIAGFFFEFGQPVDIAVSLRAASENQYNNWGWSSARFLEDFRVYEVSNPAGGGTVTPLPDATWSLVAVPEPLTFALCGLALLTLACLRRTLLFR